MATQDADELDPTLRAAWNAPEKLPVAEMWLTAATRSEAALTQYGYLILRKHLARIGAVKERHVLPGSWLVFGLVLYASTAALARDGSHSAMLRELLAELVRFAQAASGENFTWNLYQMLKQVIDEPTLCALIRPLLPPAALEKMDEMGEMLDQEREDDRRRADEGYY